MGEFAEVVRRRRMTRAFRPDPIDAALLDELVELASRAPSAGKTQGWHLLVLEGTGTERFWDVAFPVERRSGFAFPHLFDAPVVALPFADPQAYLDRYSEADKAPSGLGEAADAWPAPYWTIDASMAVMALLLAAEDAGLGTLFFAVRIGEPAVRQALGVPERLQLLGAIALGHPADEPAPRQGRSVSRRRRPPAEIIHRAVW